MRSFVPTAGTIERQWHVIDAEGQVLGRIATEAARLLQGKHKSIYTPFIDTGDHVVVVNAAKVRLTGRKEDQKIYRQHSGYEGGLREERARLVRQRKPERLVEDAARVGAQVQPRGRVTWQQCSTTERVVGRHPPLAYFSDLETATSPSTSAHSRSSSRPKRCVRKSAS